MPDPVDLLEDGKTFEQHGVLDRALESYARAAESSADPALTAEALIHQSRIHCCRSEWEPGIDCARRAQELASAANLDGLLPEAVIAEANVLLCRGDFPPALVLFRRVLEMSQEPRLRGVALQNIGSILAQQGNLGAAER